MTPTVIGVGIIVALVLLLVIQFFIVGEDDY